ncbi:hypothetical protein BpHYR1_011912, partial [Brachionus plicatilis]
YKKGTEKCHRDPSFDRISIKQIDQKPLNRDGSETNAKHYMISDQYLDRLKIISCVNRLYY